jgi:hypothetical protein
MMSLGAESTINPPSLGKAYLLFISVYFNLAPASLRPERARRSGPPASGRIIFYKDTKSRIKTAGLKKIKVKEFSYLSVSLLIRF